MTACCMTFCPPGQQACKTFRHFSGGHLCASALSKAVRSSFSFLSSSQPVIARYATCVAINSCSVTAHAYSLLHYCWLASISTASIILVCGDSVDMSVGGRTPRVTTDSTVMAK